VSKRAAEEQAPTVEELSKLIKDKVAQRCPGTAFFFSPSDSSISPGVWQLIDSLHTLPKRAVLLNVRFELVPFVSPFSPLGQTALFIEPLGHGLFKVTAFFGYAQSKVYAKTIALDTIKELDRILFSQTGEIEGTSNENPGTEIISPQSDDTLDESKLFKDEEDEKILYIICREHIQSKRDSSIFRRLFVRAFTFLQRNAPDIADSYHIPTENLIEMGVRLTV